MWNVCGVDFDDWAGLAHAMGRCMQLRFEKCGMIGYVRRRFASYIRRPFSFYGLPLYSDSIDLNRVVSP